MADAFSTGIAELLQTTNRAHLTSTGAQALMLALFAVGTAPGDEIIIPTYVCHEVRDAVIGAGGTPVYCDVGADWRMSEHSVAKVWTNRTAAILAVTLFGLPLDVAPLRRFGVPIIGDYCQSFDAAVPRFQPARDRGDLAVLSFHATKCMGVGRGGAVVALNRVFASALQAQVSKNLHSIAFPDLQAGLGLSILRRYPLIQRRRESIFQSYLQVVSQANSRDIASARGIAPPFRFVIRQHERPFEELQKCFAQAGVIVRRGVDCLLHREAALSDELFPQAVSCFIESVSLPAHASLTDEELAHCLMATRNVLNSQEI